MTNDFLPVRSWMYPDNGIYPITYSQTVKVRDCLFGTLNPTTQQCDCTQAYNMGPGYCRDGDGRCTLYAKLDPVVNLFYCGDIPLSERPCSAASECS